VREDRRVREQQHAEGVLGPERFDERQRGGPDAVSGLGHAAAGVEREHDGNRRHRLLEGVDVLSNAVFEDL
jgi:hypothetical protein